MKNKKVRLIIICVVSLILIITGTSLYLIQYNHINSLYPNLRKEIAEKGEVLSINDIHYSCNAYKIYTPDKLMSEYPDIDKKLFNLQEDEKIIIVNLTVKNNSDKEKQVELYNLVLKSKTWNNAVNAEIVHYINNDISITPILKPGEQINVNLPYNAYDTQFYQRAWENFDNRKFELIYTYYPVNYILKLN